MSVQAVDWVGVEDAIHSWCKQATGIDGTRIRTLSNRDLGEAKGPGPKATICLV